MSTKNEREVVSRSQWREWQSPCCFVEEASRASSASCSSLQALRGGKTLLLSFKGRKSNQTYTIPLNYTGDDAVVICFTHRSKRWWNNLRGGVRTMLNIEGRCWQGVAEAVADDQAAIERELYTFLCQSPDNAKYLGVQLDVDGRPSQVDIARSARSCVLVRIQRAYQCKTAESY